MVQSYDAARSKWHVRLQRREKELLVPESALTLSFCLNCQALKRGVKLVKLTDEAQGACGRGLALAQPVAPGAPLFEEPPLVVTRASPERVHEERWRAYVTLMLGRGGAASGADAELSAALAAFDDLGICDTRNESVERAAGSILGQALRASGADGMGDEERRKHVEQVFNALMRFQSNQFKFDNGCADDCARFRASAVFHYTSRLNHSCEPSAFVETKRCAKPEA